MISTLKSADSKIQRTVFFFQTNLKHSGYSLFEGNQLSKIRHEFDLPFIAYLIQNFPFRTFFLYSVRFKNKWEFRLDHLHNTFAMPMITILMNHNAIERWFWCRSFDRRSCYHYWKTVKNHTFIIWLNKLMHKTSLPQNSDILFFLPFLWKYWHNSYVYWLCCYWFFTFWNIMIYPIFLFK